MSKTTQEFIIEANNIHNYKYDYSLVHYVNNNTKVKIICKKHGEFLQKPSKHINEKQGCRKCFFERVQELQRKTPEQFANEANIIHKNKYDYSLVKYVNNKTNVIIICPIHGQFLQSPDNHLVGKGCKYCGGTTKLNQEQFIEKAIEVHGNKYDYSQVVYTLSKNKVKIICPIHGIFEQTANNHISKKRDCPDCIGGGSSKHEKEINEYLKFLNIETILHDTNILNGMELDMLCNLHNLAIEFNGLYWHSSEYKINLYHLNKTNKCKENGIDLIHVFEDEWESKQDIVKSNIKNILNLNVDVIQSTDCIILEVDLPTTKEFLNKNHIEGYTDYNFSYGLFFKDQLVSIICLKKINRGYEIVRDCNLLNVDAVDGFNTLLNHFIDSHKPNKIIVYADRRWYFGGKYEKSNFILSKTIKPKYRYVVNNKRKTIAEYKELNLEEKHFKIYDCGYFEYELMIS